MAAMSFSTLAARCARATPSKWHLALPLLIMGMFYWISSLPGKPLPDDPALYGLFYWLPPAAQNALHVPAYAALAWAWGWALRPWIRVPVTAGIVASAIAASYGVLDEWHQSFVPGRHASLTDIVLNLAGVALGIWLAARFGSNARTLSMAGKH
jgi:hypothetical protein